MYIRFQYSLQTAVLPHDAVVPEIPCKEDGLAGHLDAKHIRVQGRVIHIEGENLDAGNRRHPLPCLIGTHPLHHGKTFFLVLPVYIGDENPQNILSQRADVHGDLAGDLLEQAVVVAVV